MSQGAQAINGLVNNIEVPADKDSGKFVINYQQYTPGSKRGTASSMEVDYVIGSDGANSRVAKVRGNPISGLLKNAVFNDKRM